MKRINNKILLIFAILLMFACQVSAFEALGINTIQITPNQPSNTDLITFSISGWASMSGSSVTSNFFSQNGTALTLDLYVDMGASGAVSYWNFDKQIQPLVAGIYSLEIRTFDNRGGPFEGVVQDTSNTGFTVTPEPATAILLMAGAIFLRRRSR